MSLSQVAARLVYSINCTLSLSPSLSTCLSFACSLSRSLRSECVQSLPLAVVLVCESELKTKSNRVRVDHLRVSRISASLSGFYTYFFSFLNCFQRFIVLFCETEDFFDSLLCWGFVFN